MKQCLFRMWWRQYMANLNLSRENLRLREKVRQQTALVAELQAEVEWIRAQMLEEACQPARIREGES